MTHPDFDQKPSKNPFDKYPVIGYRLEQGEIKEDRFFVFEMDLTRDDLGPRTFPTEVSEARARARLAELGLSEEEIEARFAWCRKWMATRILKPGQEPVMPSPPL
jgi:hypothetical protein